MIHPNWLEYTIHKMLPDGRIAAINIRGFNTILIVGDPADGLGFDDQW